MQQIHALDLLSLVWTYCDAVSIVKGKDELPSVIYEETLMYALSRKNTADMLRNSDVTGDRKLDDILLRFHEQPFVKTVEV